jgi:topoisomerase-4 subunit A
VLQFDVDLADLAIKGKQSRGNVVTKNEIHRISLKEHGVSTLGDREIWFDADILRLNYDGHGRSLGKFGGEDRILVIMKNGDYYTTTCESTNHYEEGILRIEKFDANRVWTAVVNDADQGYVYMKRFTLDDSDKKQSIIGGNPESVLLLLSEEKYPRFDVKFGEGDSFRGNVVIDADEFIGVKSFHAKGKRVSNYNVASVKEVEPRKVEEIEETTTVANIDNDDVEEDEPTESFIDQQDVRDKLTGQQRLFDDNNTDDGEGDDNKE